MMKTVAGVDLAKKVIQVCVYANKKVRSNTEMTPNEFTCWLANSESVTVIFEACGTSNYWKQLASSFGHDARLISPKLVASVRQNQKTDKNDALAIIPSIVVARYRFYFRENNRAATIAVGHAPEGARRKTKNSSKESINSSVV